MSRLWSGSAAGVVARGLGQASRRLVTAPNGFFIERDRPPGG